MFLTSSDPPVFRSQWKIMGELSLSMLSGTAASWTSCAKLRRRRGTNLKIPSWRLRRSSTQFCLTAIAFVMCDTPLRFQCCKILL